MVRSSQRLGVYSKDSAGYTDGLGGGAVDKYRGSPRSYV